MTTNNTEKTTSSLKIYFAGSIAGGRKYLDTYIEIVDFLKKGGHQVLSDHIVRPDVLEYEKNFTDGEVFERDLEWINRCDIFIAEVSNPSLGVGYEIGYALSINKNVLCLYGEEVFLTRMLTGNNSPCLTLKKYDSEKSMKEGLKIFLKNS